MSTCTCVECHPAEEDRIRSNKTTVAEELAQRALDEITDPANDPPGTGYVKVSERAWAHMLQLANWLVTD